MGKRAKPKTKGAPLKKSRGRKLKLTAEVEATVCSFVRAGAFAHVAAGAAGIGTSTFFHWMADERPRYRKFRHEVEKAQAEARVSAEVVVKKMNPVAWLRLGPGRDKDGSPGWTETAKVELTGKDGAPLIPEQKQDLSKLSGEELAQLEALLAKTTPHPE